MKAAHSKVANSFSVVSSAPFHLFVYSPSSYFRVLDILILLSKLYAVSFNILFSSFFIVRHSISYFSLAILTASFLLPSRQSGLAASSILLASTSLFLEGSMDLYTCQYLKIIRYS